MKMLIGKDQFIDVSEIAYARVSVATETWEESYVLAIMKGGAEVAVRCPSDEQAQELFEKMFPPDDFQNGG